ncbi:Xaa-Pro peptidase family protein [Nitratireductor sp. ZSWI3]|uniref:M24 family metallopeptidase n=1 Tax=Nitratireductor sp. ZSWI3 TaxID=2966359 RepID=UPI00215033F8|nr:M24 family metallopeptidase [Nitratireductor sp. ZSWI3]MCR4266139.1 M24 family metallopeptidase [Nitratireductor sp. ZSWI3]
MSSLSDQRLEALRRRMHDTGTHLVAIGPSSHMMYMAGLDPHGDERPVMLLVSRDHAGFLMPALNIDSSRQKTALPFFAWRDDDGPDAALADLLKASNLPEKPSVVIDETMRADFALLLLDALPGAQRRFTGDTVGHLRARKDAGEYERLKASALLNDKAAMAGFDALKPGISELDVAAALRDVYKAAGAAPVFTSVCFGGNGAFPHHHTGETKLKEGDAVLIDTGGRLDGYPSDMTRVGFFGTPSAEFEKVHGIVERAVTAALAAARPGIPASAVDKAARDVITEAGYGEFFTHRTGHGLGIDIHEPPYLTATSETVLDEGMVFSIEPGIYLPGTFGLRLEEIVILRADGPEILSGMPRAAQIRG